MNRLPSRSIDNISDNTRRILEGVHQTLQLSKRTHNNKIYLDAGQEKLAFDTALKSGRFVSAGRGIYKETVDGPEIDKIWVKKEFTNEDGSTETWLVAYTSDEDEMVRKVANKKLEKVTSISKTASPRKSYKQLLDEIAGEDFEGSDDEIDDLVDAAIEQNIPISHIKNWLSDQLPLADDELLNSWVGIEEDDDDDLESESSIKTSTPGDPIPEDAYGNHLYVGDRVEDRERGYRGKIVQVVDRTGIYVKWHEGREGDVAMPAGDKVDSHSVVKIGSIKEGMHPATFKAFETEVGEDLQIGDVVVDEYGVKGIIHEIRNDGTARVNINGDLKMKTLKRLKKVTSSYKTSYRNKRFVVDYMNRNWGMDHTDLVQACSTKFRIPLADCRKIYNEVCEGKENSNEALASILVNKFSWNQKVVNKELKAHIEDVLSDIAAIVSDLSQYGGGYFDLEDDDETVISLINDMKESVKGLASKGVPEKQLIKSFREWVRNTEGWTHSDTRQIIKMIKDVYAENNNKQSKKVIENNMNKTAANPNPKDIPIAQGIKSKNITIDETGGMGTAKVTIEFTDVKQGWDFYQNKIQGQAPVQEPEIEGAKEPPQKGMQPMTGQAALKRRGDTANSKLLDLLDRKGVAYEVNTYNSPEGILVPRLQAIDPSGKIATIWVTDSGKYGIHYQGKGVRLFSEEYNLDDVRAFLDTYMVDHAGGLQNNVLMSTKFFLPEALPVIYADASKEYKDDITVKKLGSAINALVHFFKEGKLKDFSLYYDQLNPKVAQKMLDFITDVLHMDFVAGLQSTVKTGSRGSARMVNFYNQSSIFGKVYSMINEKGIQEFLSYVSPNHAIPSKDGGLLRVGQSLGTIGHNRYKSDKSRDSEYSDDNELVKTLLKNSFNEDITPSGKRPSLSIGDEVGYHGREGTIRGKQAGGFIVYFEDTGEEEYIDSEELYNQMYGGDDEVISKLLEKKSDYGMEFEIGTPEWVHDVLESSNLEDMQRAKRDKPGGFGKEKNVNVTDMLIDEARLQGDYTSTTVDAMRWYDNYIASPLWPLKDDETLSSLIVNRVLKKQSWEESIYEYDVTARAYQRVPTIDGSVAYDDEKPVGEERTERINVKTNELFNGAWGKEYLAETPEDVRKIFERFWNELNPDSETVVVVSTVEPVSNRQSSMSKSAGELQEGVSFLLYDDNGEYLGSTPPIYNPEAVHTRIKDEIMEFPEVQELLHSKGITDDKVKRVTRERVYSINGVELSKEYYSPSDSMELYDSTTNTWYNLFGQQLRNPKEYDTSSEGYTPFGDERDDDFEYSGRYGFMNKRGDYLTFNYLDKWIEEQKKLGEGRFFNEEELREKGKYLAKKADEFNTVLLHETLPDNNDIVLELEDTQYKVKINNSPVWEGFSRIDALNQFERVREEQLDEGLRFRFKQASDITHTKMELLNTIPNLKRFLDNRDFLNTLQSFVDWEFSNVNLAGSYLTDEQGNYLLEDMHSFIATKATPDELAEIYYKLEPFIVQLNTSIRSSLKFLSAGSMIYGADISDQVAPLSWTTESDDEPAGGIGNSQPQVPPAQEQQQPPANQNPQPPTGNPIYDSTQDTGPEIQTTVNPKSKEVTIKFMDSAEQQALKDAINQPQKDLTNPQQQETQMKGLPQSPQMPGTEEDFSDMDVPVDF